MITPDLVSSYVRAEPFRPFRIRMASGKTFDVRHPETLKVLRNHVIVFKYTGDTPEIFDEWESVSLTLTESISALEPPIH